MLPPPTSLARTGPTSRSLDFHGRRIHLLEWSPPRPRATLLCVHGGCANAHWWYHCGNLLGANYRLLAIDLCGHGESDPLVDGGYSLESHGRDIAGVLEALELDRVVLIGHSFGAFVSLAALPILEGSLAALVLVDSRGHIRKRAARYLNALGKFRNPIYDTRADAIENFQLLPRAHATAPEVLHYVAEHSIRRTPDGTWTLAFDRRALRATRERDFRLEMARMREPVLIVRGEHSTTLTEKGLLSLIAEIPHACGETVPGAHHHVMLDQPEIFAQVIAGFVGSIVTG